MTGPGDGWNRDLAASYDLVSERYADRFSDELDAKPFDRQLLDRFAVAVAPLGRTCDIGCGPGHVARYLTDRGVDAMGLDLSPEMVRVASERNPAIPFETGDMLALGVRDAALGSITAFYSLIHIARDDVPRAFGEMRRVLVDGGQALVAVHQGEGAMHADEFLGEAVSIDVTLFEPGELLDVADATGFDVTEMHTREPYEAEYQSRRLYLWLAKR